MMYSSSYYERNSTCTPVFDLKLSPSPPSPRDIGSTFSQFRRRRFLHIVGAIRVQFSRIADCMSAVAPALRQKTARLRGEAGLCCAYCLEPCVLPDTKRPRRHRRDNTEWSPAQPLHMYVDSDRLATCTRCSQSWHMACGSRELQCIMKTWAEQQTGELRTPPIYRCPTCRAVLTGDQRDAKVNLTPPRRKTSLENKFREAKRDLDQEEKFVQRVRKEILENDELRNSGVRSMLTYIEQDLAKARARLMLIAEQLKARKQARIQEITIRADPPSDEPAANREPSCRPCEP